MDQYEVNKNWILGAVVVALIVVGTYFVFFTDAPRGKGNEVIIGYDRVHTANELSITPATTDTKGEVRRGFYREIIPAGMVKSPRRGEYIWLRDQSVMVYVPQGPFMMGDMDITAAEPLHKVDVSGYYMDKYEITLRQFKKFCQTTGRKLPTQPTWVTDDHPVVNVSWEDARSYADWAAKLLPTEAQWEKAARGGHSIPEWGGAQIPMAMRTNPLPNRLYPWGNGEPNLGDSFRCNYRADNETAMQGKDGYEYGAPVGSFVTQEGSIYGCCDLIGNVREWCRNFYQAGYNPKKATNPLGPAKGSTRVTRGGGWNTTTNLYTLRLTYRTYNDPKHRDDALGFRLVKENW